MKKDLSKITKKHSIVKALKGKLSEVSKTLNNSETNHYMRIIKLQGTDKEIAIGKLSLSSRAKYLECKKVYDTKYKKCQKEMGKVMEKKILEKQAHQMARNAFLEELKHGKYELTLREMSQFRLPSMEELKQDGTFLGGFFKNKDLKTGIDSMMQPFKYE